MLHYPVKFDQNSRTKYDLLVLLSDLNSKMMNMIVYYFSCMSGATVIIICMYVCMCVYV